MNLSHYESEIFHSVKIKLKKQLIDTIYFIHH